MALPSIKDLRRDYHEAIIEAQDWFEEGKAIARFVLPGRGRFDSLSNAPGKTTVKRRSFSSRDIVNPVAEDAVEILTSGMHGRLTGQSRHWCRLDFVGDPSPPSSSLRNWLYDCQKRLHEAWNLSNFYEVMPGFYKECAGFGNASVHNEDDDEKIFHFDLLTFGEYVLFRGKNGRIDKYFRYIDMSLRQLELHYGKANLPEDIQDTLTADNASQNTTKRRVIVCVYARKHRNKPWTSVHFLESGNSSTGAQDQEKPLRIAGYHEFPYHTARWDAIGTDNMGVGVGSRILPLSKRLQEMEKAFLIATHKAVNPPYNVPARMRGKANTLPGGYNYVANPNEKVEPIVNAGFDYSGVSAASERVEMAIRKACFNDVFLTGMRDPNASPLKAREVDAREDEGVIRLGPVIGRLYSEALCDLVTRCFNSMLRRGLFAPMDPEMLKTAGGINITLIGPLAQQQKLIEVRSIQNFFQFVAGIVPFDDTARDKINTDRTIDEVADMTGVPAVVLNTEAEVAQRRQARAQAQQKQQALAEKAAQTQIQGEGLTNTAAAARDFAGAGLDISEIMGGSVM